MKLIWCLWLLFGLLNLGRNLDALSVYRHSEQLSSVPSDISESVVELHLWINEITNITQEDFNYKYPFLETLYLTNNNIARVEEGCFRGTQLRYIGVSENQLNYFPDFCEVNRTLKFINLYSNVISKTSPGDVSCLAVLESLILDSNPLVSLCDLVRLLPSLTSLNIKRMELNCCWSMVGMKDLPTLYTEIYPCLAPSSLIRVEWRVITKTQLNETTCGKTVEYTYFQIILLNNFTIHVRQFS